MIRLGLLCTAAAAIAAALAPEARAAQQWSAERYTFEATAGERALATPEGHTLRFGLPEVRIAGAEPWGPAVRRPAETTGTLSYDHGRWAETYAACSSGVQQIFVLRECPGGAVRVRIPFTSDLSAKAESGGIVWDAAGVRGEITYSSAYAMDAAGRVTPLPITLADGAIELPLSAELVALSRYPLIIDPMVGSQPTAISNAGKIWRFPVLDIEWNPLDQRYLVCWHDSVGYTPDDGLLGKLTASAVNARVVSVDTNPATPIDQQIGVGTTVTFATGVGAHTVMCSPRLCWNPTKNEYLMVWSEGLWDPTGTDDTSVSPILNESAQNSDALYHDLYPPDSEIWCRRFTITAATNTINVTMPAVNVFTNPGTLNGATPYTPAIYPDAAWDGLRYIVVWEQKEVRRGWEDTTSLIDRYFWTRHRPRARSLVATNGVDGIPGNADDTVAADPAAPAAVDIGGWSYRVFMGTGGSTFDGTMSFGTQEPDDSIPFDMVPRVASLILPDSPAAPDPGTGKILGNGNDNPRGSLIVWSLTSLVFNVAKSRIRGRFIQPGAEISGLGSIIFDVFNDQSRFVGRPAVAAGVGRDDPATAGVDEALTTSHFGVMWQTLSTPLSEGAPLVEIAGSIEMRLTDARGIPGGAVIPVASGGTSDQHQWPTIAWGYENEQYFLAWTRVDTTLFNPVTSGRSYFPKTLQLLDNAQQTMAPVATLYAQAVSSSYRTLAGTGLIPDDPSAANHHAMVAGVEDDFAAAYVRRYQFPVAPVVGNPEITLCAPTCTDNPNALAAGVAVELIFNTPNNTTTPAAQTLRVTNSGGQNTQLAWSADPDQQWITAAPATGQLGQNQNSDVSVTVDPTGLLEGTYTGFITVSAPLAVNTPMVCRVTLVIGAGIAAGQPGLSVAPPILSVTGYVGGASPGNQTVTVTYTRDQAQTLPATANWTLTLDAANSTPPGSSWVAADITAGSLGNGATATVTLVIDMRDPALVAAGPGAYTARFTLGSTNVPAASILTKTLTVNLTAQRVQIQVAPASLSFSVKQGGATPASQTFTLTNVADAGGQLSFTITSSATWAVASPTSGTLAEDASQTITVSVDPTGMGQGTYTATLTVSDPNAVNSPQTVAVTLTITPPDVLDGGGGGDGGGGCDAPMGRHGSLGFLGLALAGLALAGAARQIAGSLR